VRLLHRAKAKMEREARRHRHRHAAAGAVGDEDAALELQLPESILNRKGNKILGGQGELFSGIAVLCLQQKVFLLMNCSN
jgi:hypothetical protein